MSKREWGKSHEFQEGGSSKYRQEGSFSRVSSNRREEQPRLAVKPATAHKYLQSIQQYRQTSPNGKGRVYSSSPSEQRQKGNGGQRKRVYSSSSEDERRKPKGQEEKKKLSPKQPLKPQERKKTYSSSPEEKSRLRRRESSPPSRSQRKGEEEKKRPSRKSTSRSRSPSFKREQHTSQRRPSAVRFGVDSLTLNNILRDQVRTNTRLDQQELRNANIKLERMGAGNSAKNLAEVLNKKTSELLDEKDSKFRFVCGVANCSQAFQEQSELSDHLVWHRQQDHKLNNTTNSLRQSDMYREIPKY